MKIFFLCLLFETGFSQGLIDRIEPPSWWTGMADTTLQLMVHGNGIAELNVIADYKGVKVAAVKRAENPNYLFIDLWISKNTKPGKMKLVFEYQREVVATMNYELFEREEGSEMRKGFGKEDVIYLLMPDRFSNGNPDNDSVPGMLEKADRSNLNGRHGGDIEGIRQQVDYLEDLGVTAVWINPLLENNQPAYSYHGYAITDLYKTDPRFGTNEDYRVLVEDFHKHGIKVIMDMVFNHIGDHHWWMQDMPMEDWIHQFPEYTRSNFRIETAIDPYAAEFDRERMQSGWFDRHMPDLDQHNPILAKYLIQNSIWWIEYSGIDGIRMDTYPYSYTDFMARWLERIKKEYPDFSIVGETWLQKEVHTAYWQDNARIGNAEVSRLTSVTDFPMHYALKDALVEKDGWSSGLSKIYYVLSQDIVYNDPFQNLIFADNHDLTRIYTSLGEDFDKYKMAMAILLTTRGIPMIYYGTEYLMTGEESKGHGYIREEFPVGSWQLAVGSSQSAVSGQQSAVNNPESGIRNPEQPTIDSLQQEAHEYLKILLNWRKGSEVIKAGKLKQFVPQDGIYVYFRYTDEDAVMVVVNKNEESKELDLARFQEAIRDYTIGKDVVTRGIYEMAAMLRVPAETVLVLELE
jgi:glycosidase